jgi:ornithine carbamoyltransferase
MKRDFLTLLDFSSSEISEIIDLAKKLKDERNNGIRRTNLDGKSAVLIFDKPSLRTKLTFETGIYELGGNALSMAATNGKLGERESVADMAHNLERWVHLLVVRTFEHETLVDFAKESSIPVINALTDSFHPCQSIALGLAIKEKFNDEKITLVYLGDGNNVCVSHMLYAVKMGHNFVAATPKGYEPKEEYLKIALEEAERNGCTVTITNDPKLAVKDADLVYTDVWASMGQEDEIEARDKIFSKFQVNSDIMSSAPESALFSHCLPAHRGSEVTDEVIDSEKSIVFDEAENRLHAHKAVMVYLISQGD